MSKTKKIIIAANLIAILAFFCWSVYEKKQMRQNGKLVLLELQPVDPRSLIQGDYMQLAYQNERILDDNQINYAVLRYDTLQVANIVRLQSAAKPLKQGEFIIKCRVERYQLHLGANSYFFEQGLGSYFALAKYGGLRVDANGNTMLIGLFDSNMQLMTNEKASQYVDSMRVSQKKILELE